MLRRSAEDVGREVETCTESTRRGKCPPKAVHARISGSSHFQCNGSDVFCSDICTCRPYLTFGIEEAVKEAQKGGSGVVIYFRKEGRALGEVTKVRSAPDKTLDTDDADRD